MVDEGSEIRGVAGSHPTAVTGMLGYGVTPGDGFRGSGRLKSRWDEGSRFTATSDLAPTSLYECDRDQSCCSAIVYEDGV